MKTMVTFAKRIKKFVPERFWALGRRILFPAEIQAVDGEYEIFDVSREKVTQELCDAWKDQGIPKQQRVIADIELRRMYQGEIVPVYQAIAEAIRATGHETGSIIEVGCASGYYYEVLRHLICRDVQYIGIDYSQPLIAEAHRRYPHVAFGVGDAIALPLASRSCDVLISGCVILHVPDYKKAIAESARVAREWVIFHRTPVTSESTMYHTKTAYGIRCIEIQFGEPELLTLLHENGLHVIADIIIARETTSDPAIFIGLKTYVCRKQDALHAITQN